MTGLLETGNKTRKSAGRSFLPGIILLVLSLALNNACKKTSPSPTLEQEHLAPDEIILSSEAIRAGGIETRELEPVKIKPSIKVPGEIKFNPRLHHRLTSRIPGRVEQILAFEGDRVKPGQCLVRLFSPAFLEGVTDLRLAHERWQRLSQLDREEREAARSIFESARVRLKLLGLSEAEIDELLQNPEDHRLYCLRSPVSGQIISRQVLTGDLVEAGAVLMEVADTETLWVEVLVHEKDLARVSPGLEATVHVQAYPDLDFKGRLSYLGPVVEDSTRRVKGRVEIRNQNGLLKPGMYADVFLRAPEITVMAVPEEAIQEISGRKVVFVQEGEGRFRTRTVQVGTGMDGWVPVLQGLDLGEKYVSRGAFVLKSELLKSSFEEDEHHHD